MVSTARPLQNSGKLDMISFSKIWCISLRRQLQNALSMYSHEYNPKKSSMPLTQNSQDVSETSE